MSALPLKADTHLRVSSLGAEGRSRLLARYLGKPLLLVLLLTSLLGSANTRLQRKRACDMKPFGNTTKNLLPKVAMNGGVKVLKLSFVLMIGVLASACAPVQEIERVPDVTPPMASTFAASRSTVYERSILRSTVGEGVVTLQTGLACVGNSQGTATSEQQAVVDQDYENVFQDEFAKAGYRIARTVGSGDLFTDKKQIPADFRIAGVITKRKMNICNSVAGTKGEASLTVEWQVWDNSKNAVVYVTIQKGYAIEGYSTQPFLAVAKRIWRAAFARAVRGLLADDGFLALLSGAPTTPVVKQGTGVRS
jgi:hypothetical protein